MSLASCRIRHGGTPHPLRVRDQAGAGVVAWVHAGRASNGCSMEQAPAGTRIEKRSGRETMSECNDRAAARNELPSETREETSHYPLERPLGMALPDSS